jgi:preprotein translocase subunit Sec61beta
MDRAAFFDAIRPAFGGKLSEAQVSGMGAILDEAARLPLHHVAHILANVRRETGGYMAPIKETVMPHHKNKNPSDAEVKRRLDVAFKAGKLPWVKAPYWLDGWFGRGQIQITHRVNYQKFGIVNPDDALKLPVSARVAVQGMVNGRFTGNHGHHQGEVMDFAPIARIVLRYIAGGMILGSAEMGEKLATDPDLVMAVGLAVGAAVEVAYGFAKRKGWTT